MQKMHALIIKVECHSMANKVLGTRFQPERLIDLPHRIFIKIDAWVTMIDNQSHRVLEKQARKKMNLDEWQDPRLSSFVEIRRISLRGASQRDPSMGF